MNLYIYKFLRFFSLIGYYEILNIIQSDVNIVLLLFSHSVMFISLQCHGL